MEKNRQFEGEYKGVNDIFIHSQSSMPAPVYYYDEQVVPVEVIEQPKEEPVNVRVVYVAPINQEDDDEQVSGRIVIAIIVVSLVILLIIAKPVLEWLAEFAAVAKVATDAAFDAFVSAFKLVVLMVLFAVSVWVFWLLVRLYISSRQNHTIDIPDRQKPSDGGAIIINNIIHRSGGDSNTTTTL